MSQGADFHSSTLNAISMRCAQETQRFFRREEHDPRFCYELFRRAVEQRNERAWEMIFRQYQPLVARWITRHSLFAASQEETDYFVSRAFEKMWVVLTPEKFASFPDLKAILRYLQMCVHSALVDHTRRRERATILDDLDVADSELPSPAARPDVRVIDGLARDELWQALHARVKDEREAQVLYGTFVLALKPAELYATYPALFSSVNDVYRVKENLIARLRRDQELQTLFENA